MKYILIFLLSFSLIQPAYAAREVKGTVPDVKPLQPPAEGVAPNFEKNIQFSDPSHNGQFDDAPDAPTDSQNPQANPSGYSSADNQNSSDASSDGFFSLGGSKTLSFLWLVIIVGLGFLAYWGFKKSKTK